MPTATDGAPWAAWNASAAACTLGGAAAASCAYVTTAAAMPAGREVVRKGGQGGGDCCGVTGSGRQIKLGWGAGCKPLMKACCAGSGGGLYTWHAGKHSLLLFPVEPARLLPLTPMQLPNLHAPCIESLTARAHAAFCCSPNWLAAMPPKTMEKETVGATTRAALEGTLLQGRLRYQGS